MDNLEMDPLLSAKQTKQAEEKLLPTLQEKKYATFTKLLTSCTDGNPMFDVNRIIDDNISKTLLEIATIDNHQEVVPFLLSLGANPNQLNERHNATALHFAAENNLPKILQLLLESPKTDPNVLAGQQTPLHVSVQKKDYECTKVLLSFRADPNIPNSKGQTPVHLAANSQRRDLVELFLNESEIPLDLDTFRDFRKQSARDVLTKKCPDLQLPEIRTWVKVNEDMLRYHLIRRDESQFSDLLKVAESLNLNQIKELLKIAAAKNLEAATEDLLVLENVESSMDMTEIAEIALESGYFGVLKMLLGRNEVAINKEHLLLKAAQLLGVPCSGENRGSTNIRLECLKLILEKGANVRCADVKGNTSLHYAARSQCPEAVDLLLQAGSYIGHENAFGVSPLSHLSSAALLNYFDKCLQCFDEYSDDYEIVYDYRCFICHDINHSITDTTKSETEHCDTHLETKVLMNIASSSKLKHLLAHPLLSTFLDLKWSRISYVIYTDLILYFLFYLFLNLHIFLQSDGYEFKRSNATDAILENGGSFPTVGTGAFYYLALLFYVLMCTRSFVLLLTSPLKYLQSFENSTELLLLLLIGFFLSKANPQIASVVILLTAWKLVIRIGHFPKMAVGIQMFKTVSWNFTKFLCLYAILIFAFAFSFYVLFQNSDDESFPYPGLSIFRTVVMLTGEFEATSIPFMTYPVLSHLIFVLFVFFIAICLFNLLTGLAVSDTSEILSKAQIVSLSSRTNLLWNIESFVMSSKTSYDCIIENVDHSPLTMVRKQIFLFPNYLPQGKIGVKPFKNELTIPGKNTRLPFKMDHELIEKSKEILSRLNGSNEDKILLELKRLDASLKEIMKRIEVKC